MPSLRLLACWMVLAPGHASLSGRVTDASGAGVEGARVLACPIAPSRASGCATAVTQRQGVFQLSSLRLSAYRVTASTETGSGERIVAAGTKRVDVVVSPFGRITGTATDGAGRALAGVSVRAWLPSTAQEYSSYGVSTDQSGAFDLPRLVPGPYVLALREPRSSREALLTLEVRSGALLAMGKVPLAPLPTIRGVVVDTSGDPIPGASVEADDMIEEPGRPAPPTAVTNANGTFALHARAGSLRLRASHPRYIATVSKASVNGSDVQPPVQIMLNRGGRVQGRLLSERWGGRLRVLLRPSSDEARPREPTPRSNAVSVEPGGTFAFDRVPAGRATVVLTADGASEKQLEVKEVEIQEGQTAKVDFTGRGIQVAGRITVLRRRAPGLRIEARLATATGAATGTANTLTAVTDEEGSYAFVVPAAGLVTVAAAGHEACPRLPQRTIEVPDVEAFTADLDFAPTVIAGTVIDAASRQPLEKAAVSIVEASAGTGAAFDAADETAAEGTFRLCVDRGDYRVTLRREGYVPQTTRLAVAAESPDLLFEMTRGGTIEGRVSNSRGEAVVSAVVSAAAREQDRVRAVASALTDVGGSFSMGGLSDQEHTLFVQTRDGAVGTARARPGTGLVAITVRERARVVIRLLGAGGAPVDRGSIRLTHVDGIAVAGFPVSTTAPDGTAEMIVPPGDATFRAWKDQLAAFVSLTVAPGNTLHYDLTLGGPTSN